MSAAQVVREVQSSDLDYVLFLNTSANPSDAEWNEAMGIYTGIHARRGFTRLRVFVVTEGGGPNTRQRGQFNGLANGQPYPAAIVMTNVLARGVITAFSFFNPKIRAFSPHHMADALRHVEASQADIKAITRALNEMGKELPLSILPEVLSQLEGRTEARAAAVAP